MTWMDIQYLNCWRSFYQLFLFIVPFSRAASHVNENGDRSNNIQLARRNIVAEMRVIASAFINIPSCPQLELCLVPRTHVNSHTSLRT